MCKPLSTRNEMTSACNCLLFWKCILHEMPEKYKRVLLFSALLYINIIRLSAKLSERKKKKFHLPFTPWLHLILFFVLIHCAQVSNLNDNIGPAFLSFGKCVFSAIHITKNMQLKCYLFSSPRIVKGKTKLFSSEVSFKSMKNCKWQLCRFSGCDVFEFLQLDK